MSEPIKTARGYHIIFSEGVKPSRTPTFDEVKRILLEDGHSRMPVYDGSVLGTGAIIDGPALIEQPTTTLLLLTKQQARTDDHGSFLVEQR
ncbi:MAG: hypothetical protein HC794_04330 [Nitrospiraceae bacterium]|nr:hypothetical protein [Nitrospiraceae bacterium]